MSSGKWIQGTGIDKPGHKGALHRALGVKPGTKIPSDKLAKAKNSPNEHIRRMANLASSLSHFK